MPISDPQEGNIPILMWVSSKVHKSPISSEAYGSVVLKLMSSGAIEILISVLSFGTGFVRKTTVLIDRSKCSFFGRLGDGGYGGLENYDQLPFIAQNRNFLRKCPRWSKHLEVLYMEEISLNCS